MGEDFLSNVLKSNEADHAFFAEMSHEDEVKHLLKNDMMKSGRVMGGYGKKKGSALFCVSSSL